MAKSITAWKAAGPSAVEAPVIPHKEPATGTLEAGIKQDQSQLKRCLKALGFGLITCASDNGWSDFYDDDFRAHL